MKYWITILLVIAIFMQAKGQITTFKITPQFKNNKIKTTDSLSHKPFLGYYVDSYKGQELYLVGLPKKLQKFGYKELVIDYTKYSSIYNDSINIYKCCSDYTHYNSNYEALAGKHFLVQDVIHYERFRNNEKETFLKLKEKESGDIVYFKYNWHYQTSFPFISLAYFEYLERSQIGKNFIVRGKNWNFTKKPMTDFRTGQPVADFNAGDVWQCVDVVIEEAYFKLCLILENDHCERILLKAKKIKDTDLVFEYEQAEIYRKKFGEDFWQCILNRRWKKGMTDEMLQLMKGRR